MRDQQHLNQQSSASFSVGALRRCLVRMSGRAFKKEIFEQPAQPFSFACTKLLRYLNTAFAQAAQDG
ncbi:hypothetical protein QCE64_21680 [Caballeronia sp. LZ043]|nr:hypothetical protein [Caballeronia sp. LZ043]